MSFNWSGLVGGALGGLFGGSDKDNSVTSTEPWKVQSPYLKAGFQSAAGLYKKFMNSPFYQGDLYANMNNMQSGAGRGAYNFATGQGRNLSQDMIQGSRGFLNQDNKFINNATGLTNFNAGPAANNNIQQAGQYINNDILNGQIDAASRDVNRNLTENVLPGINRDASQGGNTNSTRTGVAEGIALRGAQDRVGDISAQMRGDAYNNGLNLAEDSRQFNQNARLQGMQSGGSMLDTAIGRGMDLRNQGMQGMVNMYDLMGRAGDKFQQNNQNQLNSNFQRWQGNMNQPWDMLSRYMGTVGGANYGSNQTQTTPGSWQGAIQGALGGASAGMGLYQNFANLMNSQNKTQPYTG